jgi:hypothetical protein
MKDCLALVGIAALILSGCNKEAGQDTDDSDGPPDTLGACEAPGDIGENPLSFVDTNVIKNQPGVSMKTIHLVDIEYDASSGVAYGIGAGGMFTFEESGGSVKLLGYLEGGGGGGRGGGGGGGGTFHKMDAPAGMNFVALTSRDRGLRIVNVTDPSTPHTIGRVDDSDMSGVAYRDGLLYVVKHTGSMQVYDLSDLSQPALLTEIEGLGNPWDLIVVDDLAYVADNTLGVVVLDLSNPESPVVLGAAAAAGGVQDLTVLGDMLYAAVGSVGVETFDLADPESPLSLGVTDIGRSAVSVSAANNQLWAATQEGVVVLDISIPSQPAPLSSAKTEEWAMHVAADGDKAWIADWSQVILVAYDPSLSAPVADVTPDFLYLYEGETSATMTVTNRGGATLEINGLEVDDERVTASLDKSSLAPGESATVSVTFIDDGEPVDTSLCFSSNDPNDPVRNVEVASSSSMTSVSIGQPAADFVLNDLDGNSHQLSAQLGKPVVLAYFATW